MHETNVFAPMHSVQNRQFLFACMHACAVVHILVKHVCTNDLHRMHVYTRRTCSYQCNQFRIDNFYSHACMHACMHAQVYMFVFVYTHTSIHRESARCTYLYAHYGNRQTERQTDRQTYIHADRQTYLRTQNYFPDALI